MSEPRVLALALAELQLPEDERSRWPEGAPFPIVATRCRTATGCSCSTRGSARGTRRSTSSCGRWPIEGALAAHGIAMADVTAVANCHLHADHGGQNFLFRGRPIFAQRREWAMVHEPDYTVAEWVDAPGSRTSSWTVRSRWRRGSG